MPTKVLRVILRSYSNRKYLRGEESYTFQPSPLGIHREKRLLGGGAGLIVKLTG